MTERLGNTQRTGGLLQFIGHTVVAGLQRGIEAGLRDYSPELAAGFGARALYHEVAATSIIDPWNNPNAQPN